MAGVHLDHRVLPDGCADVLLDVDSLEAMSSRQRRESLVNALRRHVSGIEPLDRRIANAVERWSTHHVLCDGIRPPPSGCGVWCVTFSTSPGRALHSGLASNPMSDLSKTVWSLL